VTRPARAAPTRPRSPSLRRDVDGADLAESGEIVVAARGDGYEPDDVVAVHGDPRFETAGAGGVEVVAGRPGRDIEAVEVGVWTMPR